MENQKTPEMLLNRIAETKSKIDAHQDMISDLLQDTIKSERRLTDEERFWIRYWNMINMHAREELDILIDAIKDLNKQNS